MSPLAPDKRAVLAIMPQSCPRLVSVKCHVALGAMSGVLPQRSWFLERSRYGRLASFAGMVPVSALLLRLISSSFCSFPQLAGSWPAHAHSTRGIHCGMVSVGQCALFGMLAFGADPLVQRPNLGAWRSAQGLACKVYYWGNSLHSDQDQRRAMYSCTLVQPFE